MTKRELIDILTKDFDQIAEDTEVKILPSFFRDSVPISNLYYLENQIVILLNQKEVK
jgi:hypothetical protein